MRKFLLIAMVMFALPVFSQNYTMRLAHLYSDDNYQVWDYIYPSAESTKLTCINETDFISNPADEFIDSITYDERGNITKLSTWQKYWGDPLEYPNMAEYYGKWINPCYVAYEYNENNLLISRKNYNNFHDGYGFELGGIQRYNYDEAGRMTDWSMEFVVEEYQKCIIEYNEEGLKILETMQQYNFSTYYLENQTSVEYEYDENGNLVREAEFAWEEGMWVPGMVRNYEYDEYGNCITSEQKTASGTVQERKVYTYDTSISAENVYYFPNPEDDFPQLPELKSLLKSFDYYAQDDNYNLVFVTTYMLDYEVGEFAMSVEEETTLASSVYPNPTQDFVMVESSEADYVEVVDVYGRVMFSSEMNETVKVDMSGFASGIYFVKLQAGDATSVQKIMKK